MGWEVIIGLETHVQLATASKLFSGSATTFGAAPNTQACAIDIGMPGMLPVLNEKAVHMAIQFGLAVDATINSHSTFARKNYFYPDLPKGYQTSQHELPILTGGRLAFMQGDTKKQVAFHHAHLEEDAGKSIHGIELGMTGVDLNRAGTPLLEIVTNPDLRSAAEAVAYLKALRNLVRALGISDANMQEGSFRCDVNVSVRREGETEYGTRTEIKNLNSFRFIEKAIHFESKRQIDLRLTGQSIVQETRLYDEQKQITKSMRSKEDAMDYRYFPDPDLLPIVIDESVVTELRKILPELPLAKLERFQHEYALSLDDATKLIEQAELGKFFVEAIANCKASPRTIANWLLGDVAALMNKTNTTLYNSQLKVSGFCKLLNRVTEQTISTKIGKELLAKIWENGNDVDALIKAEGLEQLSNTHELANIITDIIAKNPNQANEIRAGKTKLMAYFVGQVMKATKGKANPGQVNQILKQQLGV